MEQSEYLDIIPQRKKRKVTIKAVFQRFPVQKVLHVYANGKEIPFIQNGNSITPVWKKK